MEYFRKKKRLPIVIPGLFLAEIDEQWYPPGWLLFLSALPKYFVDTYYWLISNLVDVINVIVIFYFSYYYLGLYGAAFVIMMYALNASILVEYSSMTSRSLASVLSTLFMVVLFFYIDSLDVNYIVTLIAIGMCIIYTHKLCTQMILFISLYLSIIYMNYLILTPIVLSYLLLFILLPINTKNILRAHLDILKFWNKYWPDLGKHQINQSKIYSSESKVDTSWHNNSSISNNYIHQTKRLILSSPWLLAILPALIDYENFIPLEKYLFHYVASIYIWAFLTTFIDSLKCMGEGIKYLKFIELPSLLFLALAIDFNTTTGTVLLTIVALLILLTLRNYWKTYLLFRDGGSHPVAQNENDLNSIFKFIKNNTSVHKILVLPIHLADRTAFFTRKPVLWGAHGYGFDMLHDFFPVIRKPIQYFITKFNLSHALIDANDINIDLLGLEQADVIFKSGNYILADLKRVK